MVYWLIAFVVFLIAEVVTLQFVSLWFAVGSLGGLASCMLGADIFIQIIVFFVISLVLLAVFKPLCSKLMKKHMLPSNCDELMGASGKVMKRICNPEAPGIVRVHGENWSAISEDDGITIEEETVVEIVEIQGKTLIVKKIRE